VEEEGVEDKSMLKLSVSREMQQFGVRDEKRFDGFGVFEGRGRYFADVCEFDSVAGIALKRGIGANLADDASIFALAASFLHEFASGGGDGVAIGSVYAAAWDFQFDFAAAMAELPDCDERASRGYGYHIDPIEAFECDEVVSRASAKRLGLFAPERQNSCMAELFFV